MPRKPGKVWLQKRSTRKGTSYSLCWYERGRIRQEHIGRNWNLAERRCREKEYELTTGVLNKTVDVQFEVFRREHLALSQAAKSPATVALEETLLRNFASMCQARDISDIDAGVVERFLRHRITQDRISLHTANKELRMLRAIFNAAKRRRYIAYNPAEEVPFLRAPEKPIRALSPDELSSLLAACPSLLWWLFIYLAASCGLRSAELTNLQWCNIDLDRGLIFLHNTRGWSTKSRKNRVVGITEKGLELLLQVQAASNGNQYVFTTREGNPWRNNLQRGFRAIVKRARIPVCTIHDLRRTFCTEMSKVVPPKDVQLLAGHASLDTTMRYYVANIDEQRARSAAAKLEL